MWQEVIWGNTGGLLIEHGKAGIGQSLLTQRFTQTRLTARTMSLTHDSSHRLFLDASMPQEKMQSRVRAERDIHQRARFLFPVRLQGWRCTAQEIGFFLVPFPGLAKTIRCSFKQVLMNALTLWGTGRFIAAVPQSHCPAALFPNMLHLWSEMNPGRYSRYVWTHSNAASQYIFYSFLSESHGRCINTGTNKHEHQRLSHPSKSLTWMKIE